MAYANPRLGYPADGKHPAYFEEDDATVLDPAILDCADIMQSPNGAQFRKESFANSSGVLSPADSHGWDPQLTHALAVEPNSAGALNPYHEDHNGFIQRQASQQSTPVYGHPSGSQWAFEQNSGNWKPTTGAEFMPPPPPFEAVQHIHHRADSAHGTFGHLLPPAPAFHGPHAEPGFVPAPQVQTPMSPHSHQDWMGMVQQEMDSRPMPKRMRPNSHPTTAVDFQRRDGIRKKNGRIEIPQERNIHTIEDLIDKTTDEDLLKELKQQKRLLRNREAALASRQRKKKHTEDLETKEKSYGQQVAILEKELADLSIDRQRREEERQILLHRFQESQRVIETLQEQVRDLKIQNHEETSSLRKKINVLTDQLEMGPAPAMSAAPSSTGFTDFNAEMEALNMGPHDWDNFIFVNDLHTEPSEDLVFDTRPDAMNSGPILEKRPSSTTVTSNPPTKAVESSSDQPIASGLLFMLLLCGAFVASKPASLQPKDMPKMPPAVTAAAPHVLSDLLSEAGGSANVAHARGTRGEAHEPAPSGLPLRTSSRLDRMHQRLTSPTKQQEIDQAFALTAAQYASITNIDFAGHEMQQVDAASRPRRNLADLLHHMQQEHQQKSKAEVYTRSLLWDQIPTDVVKQFKEMVRDHNEYDARRSKRSTHNDMFSYKAET